MLDESYSGFHSPNPHGRHIRILEGQSRIETSDWDGGWIINQYPPLHRIQRQGVSTMENKLNSPPEKNEEATFGLRQTGSKTFAGATQQF